MAKPYLAYFVVLCSVSVQSHLPVFNFPVLNVPATNIPASFGCGSALYALSVVKKNRSCYAGDDALTDGLKSGL